MTCTRNQKPKRLFEFHADRKRYFDIQVMNAEKYVIPFIEEKFPVLPGMRVLEIGSGEGGVLKAFINKGCTGVGVELDAPRVVCAIRHRTALVAWGNVKRRGAPGEPEDVITGSDGL